MQIAFWSNYHQMGTTYDAIAVAVMTALEYRMKILITHNHFEKSALESSFLDRSYIRSELTDLSDTGLDALSKFIKYNKIDKENISSFTTTLIKNKLGLLMGTTNTNKELYIKDLNEVIDMILTSAKIYYDMIFVDVSSGTNELSSKILEHSDLIVVNLNQNYNVLEDFFTNFIHLKEKCLFLLGRYDKNSRFNMKAIQRKYSIKGKTAVIPYNIEFADACSEGKVIDFFLRNIKADKEDQNYYFIEEARKTVELILDKLNVNILLKKLGD